MDPVVLFRHCSRISRLFRLSFELGEVARRDGQAGGIPRMQFPTPDPDQSVPCTLAVRTIFVGSLRVPSFPFVSGERMNHMS